MGIVARIVATLCLVGLALCCYFMISLSRQAKAQSSPGNLFDVPLHPVTEPMWQKARAVAGRTAPNFTLPDQLGKSVTLSEECKRGPVVLVFTKDGCPCSVEAQPLFNDLSAANPGVTFLGIIDGPQHVASKYKEDFRVPYRMLLAGDGAIFGSFDAKQSVYTTLIGQDGKVIKQWPGYNKAMIVELNEDLAKAANASAKPLDVSMAPDKLSSGCKFERAGS